MPPGVAVISCQPSSGGQGNKIFLKLSSPYELLPMTGAPMPFASVIFGSEKCAAQEFVRESPEAQAFMYSCNVEVPQLMVTGCNSTNVPLTLLIESSSGDEIARASAGTFQYLEGSADDITRTNKLNKHDTAAPGSQIDQASPSPKAEESQLPNETVTNTFDYPAHPTQYGQPYQSNNDMITAYRTSSFTEPGYQRRAGPAWSGFGGPLGSTGRSPGLDHALSGRTALTPLPIPSSTVGHGTPQLVRTSTISTGAGPYATSYPNKAHLKLSGKLDTMTENWTQEEWTDRRRLVVFRKSQQGGTIHASFRAVPPSDRQPGSICVSCIWWAEQNECFVTSVDTIALLEQLVATPPQSKFTVEEKNRIRRNLEGFHPLTVSKGKPNTEDFFRVIMGFPAPKPRNIEKDVKVFPWKILESALKKIIGKYSANTSSSHATTSLVQQPNHPPPGIGSYAPLPTPPSQTLGSQHGDAHHQTYSLPSNHNDSIPSPRSLTSSQQSWGPYSAAPSYHPAAPRPLSPNLRHHSPQQPSLRLTTAPLPTVTSYDTRAMTAGAYGTTGLHTPISHHPSTATPPRWDPAPASYSESYPSLGSHHGHSAHPVYTTAPYGDGATRA